MGYKVTCTRCEKSIEHSCGSVNPKTNEVMKNLTVIEKLEKFIHNIYCDATNTCRFCGSKLTEYGYKGYMRCDNKSCKGE